jgi:stage II sporulation protein D
LAIKAAGSKLQYGNFGTARFYLTGKYRLQIAGEHPLESRYPLEVSAKDDTLILVLSMPIEDYVAAVLAGESSNFQSDEALKAMAVVARTYAARFRGRHKTENFDFCDTTHCQDMHLSAVTDRQRVAAEATEGEMLWFQGSPAATYYHQNCGGTTAAASEVWPDVKASYLQVHADPYCLRSEHSHWESRMSKADLQSALLKAGVQVPAGWQSLRIDSRSHSGRALLLVIMGKDGKPQMKLSASTLRFAVGRTLGWSQIKSDFYELKDNGAEVLFSGRGSGHGVGMCQEGADAMGKQGKSYREILSFYFPGTALGISARGISWHRLHGEQLDLFTTSTTPDPKLLSAAENSYNKAKIISGLQLTSHPLLKIYPTLEIYRDSTGEPGWVAASTRGNTIRLQPWELLNQKGALESTLQHEFLHMLVEGNMHASLPLWFREGLVLYLAQDQNIHMHSSIPKLTPDAMEAALRNPQSQQQMQQVYASAKMTVATLVARWGKAEVMQWLGRGIPSAALASLSTAHAAQH